MWNMDQLHAHDCHQKSIRPQNITQKVHACELWVRPSYSI